MEFADWITQERGLEFIENLRVKANSAKQFTLEEKRVILDSLKEICEENVSAKELFEAGKKNA